MEASGKKSDVYRTYRRSRPGYHCCRIVVGETDLWLESSHDCREKAEKIIRDLRRRLKSYIHRYPAFLTTLKPWPDDPGAPELVKKMITASRKAGVGPMAAVAGALAEMLGMSLLATGVNEFFIENGGDLFFTRQKPRTIAVYAGRSPFSWKVGLRVPAGEPLSICTSSGTVGPSLSMGKADAAVVVSPDAALADAVATAAGNQVQKSSDLAKTAENVASIPGIVGVLLICDSKLAAWGEIELVSLVETDQ